MGHYNEGVWTELRIRIKNIFIHICKHFLLVKKSPETSLQLGGIYSHNMGIMKHIEIDIVRESTDRYMLIVRETGWE